MRDGAGAKRDADRIVAAAKAAGLTRIDNLVTTHWHGDHFGGMAELAHNLAAEGSGLSTAVFAWDARGHGRSPGLRGHAPSFAHTVRDMDQFVRHGVAK